MDPQRLQELVTRTVAFLAVLGTVTTPFTGLLDWLSAKLRLVLAADLAAPVAAGIALLVCLAALWFVWRSFRKVSILRQRDAFELRAKTADDLIGRTDDIEDFAALVQGNQLVFLTGDSGCGKSALVAAGLLPALQRDEQFLPVLVTRYGADWVDGPTREALRALWEACTPTQRNALAWTRPPSPATATPDLLAEKLCAIPETLQRIPVLLFDQFDDYQA
jgi:hypothetical protein